MNVIKTKFDGLLIIEPTVHGDHRGWFTESYSKQTFENCGITYDFVQDNHSMSAAKGTLRGLHFQNSPKAQTKLIRCTKGAIIDVVVDLRKDSSTYLQYEAIELTAENHKQFLIPKGFAHGFVTLCDDVEIQYKVDEYYSKEHDRSIRFDDPALNIDWAVKDPILSDKDKNAPLLKDSDFNF